jgi:hypothetical protein
MKKGLSWAIGMIPTLLATAFAALFLWKWLRNQRTAEDLQIWLYSVLAISWLMGLGLSSRILRWLIPDMGPWCRSIVMPGAALAFVFFITVSLYGPCEYFVYQIREANGHPSELGVNVLHGVKMGGLGFGPGLEGLAGNVVIGASGMVVLLVGGLPLMVLLGWIEDRMTGRTHDHEEDEESEEHDEVPAAEHAYEEPVDPRHLDPEAAVLEQSQLPPDPEALVASMEDPRGPWQRQAKEDAPAWPHQEEQEDPAPAKANQPWPPRN